MDKTDGIIAIALLGVAIVLRFIFLGRADLWQDEMLFVNLAHPAQKLSDVWSGYWNQWMVAMAWLPLPGVLMNLYLRACQSWVPDIVHNTFWLRVPGALLGSLAVSAAYICYRRMAARETALAGALLMCSTVFPIFYSRELHAYPLLLLASTSTLWLFMELCFQKHSRTVYVLFTLSTLVLLYTHLTASMAFAGLCFALLMLWWRLRYRESNIAEAAKIFYLGIMSALLAATVIPIYHKLLISGNPHLSFGSPLSITFIANDVVSKLFLGDQVGFSILAWLILLVGVTKTYRSGLRGQTTLVATVSAVVLIMAAAKRTQYLSVRYFTPVVPLLLFLLASGLHDIGQRAARLVRGPAMAFVKWIPVGILMAVHLFVFLPPIYSLQAKSVDFGRIAKWLNDNLSPGTPYVMHSAYELRLVPGYYATPGLVAVSPYVHGPGMEERERLFYFQQAFLTAFPEAPYVESDSGDSIWSWPKTYFTRHVRLTNDMLRRVVKMGIYPTLFRKDLREDSLITTIFYNALEDRLIAARRRGELVVLDYPRSTAIPIGNAAQGRATLYARYWPGSEAHFVAHLLATQTVETALHFMGAVAARHAHRFPAAFCVDEQVIREQSLLSNQFTSWDLLLVLNRTTPLHWRIAGPDATFVQGLVITDIRMTATNYPSANSP